MNTERTNAILATPANQVNRRLQVGFFDLYCKHYKLNEEQRAEAWEMFEQARETKVSLNLALITAITFANLAI